MKAVTGKGIGCYTPQIILGAKEAWEGLTPRLETTYGHTLFTCMKQILMLILSSSLDTPGNISK